MRKGESRANFRKIADESNLLAICMTAEKETNTNKKINFFLTNYTTAIGEESYNEMREIAQNDPIALEGAIYETRRTHGKNLSDEVEKSPEEVLRQVAPEYTTSFAQEFIGNDAYRSVRKSLEKGDDARKEFANLYESELWKTLVTLASSEAVKSAAKSYVERTARREIQENLYSMRNGKPVYDPNKAAKFIAKKISALKREEKEKIYEQIGLAYYQTQVDNGTLKISDPASIRRANAARYRNQTPQENPQSTNREAGNRVNRNRPGRQRSQPEAPTRDREQQENPESTNREAGNRVNRNRPNRQRSQPEAPTRDRERTQRNNQPERQQTNEEPEAPTTQVQDPISPENPQINTIENNTNEGDMESTTPDTSTPTPQTNPATPQTPEAPIRQERTEEEIREIIGRRLHQLSVKEIEIREGRDQLIENRGVDEFGIPILYTRKDQEQGEDRLPRATQTHAPIPQTY